MSNIQNNRIDVSMTPAQLTGVKAAFQNAEGNMPFLLGLTNEERVSLPKINVANKAFVEDAINAIVNNPTLLPGYLDISKMKNDLTLFTQLDELAQICAQVLEKIEDTRMLAGSEAYVSALAAYRLFAAASMAGLPGTDAIYNQLRQRFENNGGAGAPAPLEA